MLSATFCLVSLTKGLAATSEDPLRVLTDDDYPPYAFRSSTGELQGIVVDQWREWERATGRKVELVGMDWNEALRKMESGEADVIDTIFDTPERRALFDFGPPYAKIRSAVFFHQTISGLARLSDLKGFHVAVKSGDALIGELSANGIGDFEEYPSYEAIVRAAARGEIRVFCIDLPPALYFLNKLGIEGEFRSSLVLPGGEFHRAVPKGRADLLAALRAGFDAIPGSSYAAIDRKWFGAKVPAPVDPRIGVVVAAVFLCLCLVFALFVFVLKRRISTATEQVQKRLEELEASQAKNRAFIAALPDLFFTFDRDGRYLEYGTASMDQLVVSPDKFLGRLVTEVDLGPGLAERVMGCIKTALEERRLVVMEYEAVIAAGPRRFEGRFVPLDAERVILVARDITEARRHEELLSASLAEKEVLLREVHHRVKNNLQVISSLVSLQETSCRDQSEREMNRDTQVRIRSMAHLHELLYGSKDLSSIDSAEYLRAIVGEISGYYENPLIHVEAEPDILSIDEAMLFGLIVTELVTNALKYAYPHGSAGHIFIFYGRSALARRLEVRDEGVGLPPDFDPANSASLGYTLIRSLSDQIDGRLTIRAANPGEALPGLSVVLTFSMLPREIQASLPGA